MKTIQVRNLRSLADTGLIELKPITVLVGINSSGKSTFLRVLPLLKQSIETKTIGPISWVGNYVDFGTFQEALTTGATRQEIDFEFGQDYRRNSELEWPSFYPWESEQVYFWNNVSATFSLSVGGMHDELGTTFAKYVEIKLRHKESLSTAIEEDSIELAFNEDGSISLLNINNENVLSLTREMRLINKSSIFPAIDFSDRDSSSPSWERPARKNEISEHILSCLTNLVGSKTSAEKKYEFIGRARVGNNESLLKALHTFPGGGNSWKKRVKNISLDDARLHSLRSWILAYKLPEIVALATDYATTFASSVSYTAPVRATVERYYRNYGLAVDSVDPQGKNLAAYLQSLGESEMNDFSQWTEESIGFAVRVIYDGAHLSLRLRERGGKSEYNMTDLGFGFSQLLPMLAQIWKPSPKRSSRRQRESRDRFLAIEQPELHLHPKLQARVADLFAASVRIQEPGGKINLVVETHSEAIINRLGQLISLGKLPPEAVQVLIFEKEGDSHTTKVRKADFNSDGTLANWPYGFFLFSDEE